MGGYAFIVEEDAYLRLKEYTEAVKGNLAGSPGADEIMGDIETRIAEILRESKGGREVVKMEDITAVIQRMGEPEVYVQDGAPGGGSEGGAKAQPEPEEAAERRLHRDPDNKIIGGVCGGLGAFAGIDPLWFRLLFVACVLLYSTGFWIYIILWVVMPEAKTRIQKLQMRGKRPDLKNIENSIRSEFKGVGDNFSQMAKDNTLRDNARKVSETAGDVFAQLFKVLGKVLEIGLKIFAGIVAALSLVFLVSMIVMMATGIRSFEYSDDGDMTINTFGGLIPRLFESATEGWIFYFFIFVFLAVPTVALLANSIRYLANIQTKISKWVSFAAVGIWLLATAGLVYSGINLALDFSKSTTGKSDQVIALPKGQALHLHLLDTPDEDDSFNISDVSLDIRESADSLYMLRIYKEASGRTESDADRRQRAIEYKTTLTDSILMFPRTVILPPGEVMRGQSVTLELHVPRDRKIYIEEGMQRLLYDIDNVQNQHDSQMVEQYWIMTEKGLSCQNCPIPVADTTTTSINR